MDDIEPGSTLNARVEVIGPFMEEHRLIIGGYRVPYIAIYPLSGAEDGSYDVTLDGRFSAVFTRDELDRFAWFLANCIAIGAGYSAFGSNSRKINPFQVRTLGIAFVETEPDPPCDP